jgi:putative serine protease PepD
MSLSPKHLWAGDWRAESARARARRADELAALPEVEPRPEAPPEPPPRPPAPKGPESPRATPSSTPARRPSGPAPTNRRGLLVLALAALAAAAFAIGSLTGGGSGDRSSSQPAAELPAVSGPPIKPRKGHTRAAAIYAAASPAVVSVRSADGAGTAFLIDRKGTLVTNGHVVGQNRRVTVRFGTQSAGIDARVLGADGSSDLAVLRIRSSDVPKGVRPLQFADSSAIAVGDNVIAIGNPFDLDRTATEGIVSAVGRHIQAPNGFEIDAAIQTDAPINPGNSGGPLLDDAGHVVGVNSQIQTAGSGGNVGIGFAVPSNTARAIVPILERGHTVKRAYLGVETSPASLTGADGARVARIVPGGPAEKAGIKQGDVITKVGGRPIRDPTDISAAIAGKSPGNTVTVEIRRNGLTEKIDVALGTRPARTP